MRPSALHPKTNTAQRFLPALRMLGWLALLLALNCGRERRNPLDPETSLTKERLSPPATIVATAGKGLVHLAWTPVSSRLLGGYALSRAEQVNGTFVWLRGDGDAALNITTSKTVFVDSLGLSVKTYFYRIAAVDTNGLLSRHSPFVAVTVLDDNAPPAAPQNLTVVADKNAKGSLLLRWTAPALDADDGELTGLAGYLILRSEGNGASLAPVDTVDAQTQEYRDAGLKGVTQYTYAVQAFDPAGNYSPLSLPGQASTRGVLPASGLSATAGIERVDLRWNRSPDAALAGYNVYRAKHSDGEYLRLGGSEGTPFTTGRTAFLDSNLEGGQLYYYRVSAVTADDESALSEFADTAALHDTLAPAAPNRLEVVPATDPQLLQLSWQAPGTDAAGTALTGLHGYRVYRTDSADGVLVAVGQTADTAFADSNLTPATAYFYAVEALDEKGNTSPRSLLASATTSGVGLPQEVRLSSTTPSDAAQPPTVFISWDAVAGEIAQYEVQRTAVAGSDQDADYVEILPHTAETSRQDNTVERGAIYYYRVRARDAKDNLSDWTPPHAIFVSP